MKKRQLWVRPVEWLKLKARNQRKAGPIVKNVQKKVKNELERIKFEGDSRKWTIKQLKNEKKNNTYKKWKYTPAVRSKISSKLIFASCVWYSDRAHYELCVLIKGVGRRLPLQLQCSYQGQQGDICQSVRGNYKTRFRGGLNLTAAVEGVAIPGACLHLFAASFIYWYFMMHVYRLLVRVDSIR